MSHAGTSCCHAGDLSGADLGAVLWRCRNVDFWRGAVSALRSRRVWDEAIWYVSLPVVQGCGLREYCCAIPLLFPVTAVCAPFSFDCSNGLHVSQYNGVSSTARRCEHVSTWHP